jgi:hypothetical protein
MMHGQTQIKFTEGITMLDGMSLIQTIPWAAAKVTVSQPSADHCVM